MSLLPCGAPVKLTGMKNRRTVLAVLYDGVLGLNVTGPLEVFARAAELASPPGAYGLRTAALDGRPVASSMGLAMTPTHDLAACKPPHTLLVPGGPGQSGVPSRMVERIAELAAGAERVVSICTGTLLLAEAGLLDGRRATTHWASAEELARKFPAVTVLPDPLFVRDGNVYSSGGVTAGIDLALSLVEADLGSDVALRVARDLLVFLRRPGDQGQFADGPTAANAERHPVRKLQQWIIDNPAEDLSVDALAGRVALSPRQFARVFRDTAGVTAGKYVDSVRLNAARRRLESTDDSLDDVAHASGYGSSEVLRRAFLRLLAITPGEYRRRFRTVARGHAPRVALPPT